MAEWGKLYGTLHGSPKWRRCTKGARSLWATALSWCIDQEGSEGVVPDYMLRQLDGTKADAANLVAADLWHTPGHQCASCPQPPEGAWVFHNWARRQRTREQIEADRAAATERQRRARDRRRESQQGHGVTDGVSNGVSHAARGEERRGEEKKEETSSLPAASGDAGDAPSKPSRRKPERPLPATWEPNDAHRGYAFEHRLNVERETQRFRDHATANDRRARDWDAAFRMWLSKATERQPARPRGGHPGDQLAW